MLCPRAQYPYRIFPANLPLFSPELRSHRLVSPIRLSVLGRTYGTYLHYKRSYSTNVFLFAVSGSRGSGLTCRQKRKIHGKFPRNSGKISPQFSGKFPCNFPGNFTGISGEMFSRFPGNFPWNFQGKMTERADRFHAPDAMMMVSTATPVLHDARTRCLTMVNSETPRNVRAAVPVDRPSFQGEFKYLKTKKKLPTWNRTHSGMPIHACIHGMAQLFVDAENFRISVLCVMG